MALIKRGNTWWMDITGPDGVRRRESTKTEDRQLAEQIEAKTKLDLLKRYQLGVAADRPFDEAVRYFLDLKRDNRTAEEYARQLQWWSETFKRTTLQKIDEERIVSAILAKRQAGVSNATCNRYLAVLRALLRVAHDRKWIERVPTFKLLKEAKERVRWLNDEEIARLLQACPARWRAMIEVSLTTGLRQSNVTAMRWEWVDLERATLCIPGAFFKNGKDFAIPLPPRALAAIAQNVGRHETYVFVDDAGLPIKQISSKTWAATLKRAGIEDFRWHDLRHTWASKMAQSGVPTQVLQRLGGWQSVVMVNRYAHHDVESLREFVLGSRSGGEPAGPGPDAQRADFVPQVTAQIRHKSEKKHLRLVA